MRKRGQLDTTGVISVSWLSSILVTQDGVISHQRAQVLKLGVINSH
jgi:hypothetical protein